MPDSSLDNQSETPKLPLRAGDEASTAHNHASAEPVAQAGASASAVDPETVGEPANPAGSPNKSDWRMPIKTPKVYKEGDIVDKVYRLHKPLGSGGMGVVFACEHIELKQQYAMKILADGSVSSENWKRFQMEAKALARLHHPSIVGIHNMGIDDGEHPYYVMDLLSGETLETLLKRNGRLPVQEALQIFIQLASALEQAHSVGIIHRDIKPANVMLNKDLRNGITTARLVDFGIARLSPRTGSTYSDQHQTASGLIFGTPIYMSPEQSTGKHVDQRSDIYSLGCSLVEALTAFPPFKGDSAFATILKHQTLTPPTLISLAPNGHFSDSLESLVQKMLEKNPNDRYQTMSQVGVDMTRVLKGKSILANGLATTTVKTLDKDKDKDRAESASLFNLEPSDDSKTSASPHDKPPRSESRDMRSTKSKPDARDMRSTYSKPGGTTAPLTVIEDTNTSDSQSNQNSIAWIKPALIITVVCLILPLIGFIAYTLLEQPPHPAISTAHTVSDDDDDQSEFQVVARLLKSHDHIAGIENNSAGQPIRRFIFPDNFYLGYMQINDGEPFQAMGTVDTKPDDVISLHLQGSCTPFPIICQKLGNDNVNSLEIVTESPSLVIDYLKDWTKLSDFSLFNSLVHKEGYDDSSVTPGDVLMLDNLKNLKALGICDSRVTGKDILRLRLLKEITTLRLKNITGMTPLLQALPDYPNIKELYLNSNNIGDKEVELLAKNPNMEKLTIYRSSITPACLKSLSKMPHLKSLKLSNPWSTSIQELFKKLILNCEFIDYDGSGIH